MNHDRLLARLNFGIWLFSLVCGIVLVLVGETIPGELIFAFIFTGLLATFFSRLASQKEE